MGGLSCIGGCESIPAQKILVGGCFSGNEKFVLGYVDGLWGGAV